MRNIKLYISIVMLTFLTCSQNKASNNPTVQKIGVAKTVAISKDYEEIQTLIRQVLNWAESKESINLLPVLTDSNDSVYIRFDLKKHKENLDKLHQTGFFAKEFIDNYNQIILTLDQKIRNKEYDEWFVGDLPTFLFANDVDPWTSCQDVPYDEPSPWSYIEIKEIKLSDRSGEFEWKWGKLKPDTDPGWKNFSYRFNVVIEKNEWKISYLRGFDFTESTR